MTETLKLLVCHGKDGLDHSFWYEFGPDEIYPEAKFWFRVHKSKQSKDAGEDWFDMTVERHDPGSWRITWIGNAGQLPEYSAVGIPDALIPEASRVLNAAICSSSTIGNEGTIEWRTEDAEKMWKRLVVKGLARFIEAERRYICDSSHFPRDLSGAV